MTDINDIIVNLEDYDKSGKIDVNDFLKMTNEEVLAKANTHWPWQVIS